MPERILWHRLKDNQLGVRFTSQTLLYGYILDFYCPRAGLCVEVDGPCHLTQKEYDAHRDVALMQKGILTMRFTAQEVKNNTAAVVALINDKMRKRMA
jgi:very-short-patch-repair endonuclease